MADTDDWAMRKAREIVRQCGELDGQEEPPFDDVCEQLVASALRDARREAVNEADLTIQARIDATDGAACTGTNCAGCELRRTQRLVRTLAEVVPALAAGGKAE